MFWYKKHLDRRATRDQTCEATCGADHAELPSGRKAKQTGGLKEET